MNTIQKFDTIHQYNEFLGQETLHPLVNVIDLAQSCRLRHGLHSFGFYTVFLKEIKCGNLRYSGRAGPESLYSSIYTAISQICIQLSFPEIPGKEHDAELLSDRTFHPAYRISLAGSQY